MGLIYTIAAVFVLNLHVSYSMLPGLQMAVSMHALGYLAQIGEEYLNQNLTSTKLDDISGTVDIDVLFITYSVDYIFYDIKIESFSNGITSIISSKEKGLVFMISGINVIIRANVYIDGGIFDAETKAQLSLRGASVVAGALLGSASDGSFILSCTTCQANSGSVDVDFSGGSSWFFEVMDAIADFPEIVNEKFQSAVCDFLTKMINKDANNKVKSFPTQVEVGDEAIIDYAQTKPPYYDSKGMATFHKGEFLSVHHPSIKYNFSANPFPFFRTKRMMSFWLSEYIGNTAAITYQVEHMLNYLLTPENLNNKILINALNTHALRLIMPNFYKEYPNTNYSVFFDSLLAPQIRITEKMCYIRLWTRSNISAITSKGPVPAFSLNMNLNLSTIFNISKTLKLTLDLKALKADLSVFDSQIGDISSTEVTLLKIFFIDLVLKEGIKLIGERGFQLPSVDDLEVVNPKISFNDGFIFIEFDANIRFISKKLEESKRGITNFLGAYFK